MARRPAGAREFGLFQLWLTSRPESNGFGPPANICRPAQLTAGPNDPRLERPDGTPPADYPALAAGRGNPGPMARRAAGSEGRRREPPPRRPRPRAPPGRG